MISMVVAAIISLVAKPKILLSSTKPEINLEQIIPKNFDNWIELEQSTLQIINPQQKQILSLIYSQTFSKSYINTNGRVVMLSIAYGTNQSDNVSLHYPEVCYPAQGFQVLSSEKGELNTGINTIPVKRLSTRLGNRMEPITYWTTIGDQVVRGGIETKIAQLKYGFKGEIPDGLIFRISSISSDTKYGYDIQEEFAKKLIAKLAPESRFNIIGNKDNTKTK